MHLGLKRKVVLRYGENPHQQAALYGDARPGAPTSSPPSSSTARNFPTTTCWTWTAPGDRPRFRRPAAAVIKHNNPCGAAVADRLADALRQALAGDPLSAFGSVLGLNRPVDAATAEVLAAPGLFVEAIVAPDFEPPALKILTTKPKWKNNVRLMKVGELDRGTPHWTFRRLEGGMFVQDADVLADPEDAVEGRHRGPAPRPRKWPTCASPGRSCGTSSRTPSWWPRTSCCWAPAPGR